MLQTRSYQAGNLEPIQPDRFFKPRAQFFNSYVLMLIPALGILVFNILSAFSLTGVASYTWSLSLIMPCALVFAPFILLLMLNRMQKWYEHGRERAFLDELSNRPANDPLRQRLVHKLTHLDLHVWSVSDARRFYAMLKSHEYLDLNTVVHWMDGYQHTLSQSNRFFRWFKPVIQALFPLLGYILGSYLLGGMQLFGGVVNGVTLGLAAGLLLAYVFLFVCDGLHCYFQDKRMRQAVVDALPAVGADPDARPVVYPPGYITKMSGLLEAAKTALRDAKKRKKQLLAKKDSYDSDDAYSADLKSADEAIAKYQAEFEALRGELRGKTPAYAETDSLASDEAEAPPPPPEEWAISGGDGVDKGPPPAYGSA